MAENPARISRLFKSKTVNKHGIYCASICDMGE
jgi:hypothetical protein